MASDRDILPDTYKPTHYDLSIFDIAPSAPWSYEGLVKIDLEIKSPTNTIVLNSDEITIHKAEMVAGKTLAASNVEYDKRKQRATFTFPSTVDVTSKATLSITFQGTINNTMCGFYRSKYHPPVPAAASTPRDEEYHYMCSTQFESCDARRAFPCFDEPALKATYDFSIEIPEDLTALSNMPVKSEEKGAKAGSKKVTFDTTPVMSTYLLAWAFGDFEYLEAFTERKYKGKNLPVRIYTTRGLKEQGKYAVDHAHKYIDYYSDLFDIEYPLPKSDILAVHEFTHGAMENWGLVTYRMTAILFDEGKSDERYRNRIAYVVAHELAHQWFGDLVTMKWWNELWLNEGFATWVGNLAVDVFHPTWNTWAQFVAESMSVAFDLDSIRSSHPIEVPVRDALEVDQVFDAISYQKGSSVIRMLSAALGQDTFILGVSNYLKKHAYENASTDDLWAALSEASGRDVKAFIDPWVRKIGHPVLTIAEEPGQISFKQERFLQANDVKPEEDETVWWLPLGIKAGPEATKQSPRALTTKSDTIRDIDTGYYKINADHTGLYRTNYPPARLLTLGQNLDKITDAEKCGIISDAAALAVSGHGHTTALLGLLENFQSESNFLVWSQITSSLGHVKSIFSSNPEISEALRKFTLKLVTPAAEKVGWEFPKGEDFLEIRLRPLLIAQAGLAGHEKIVEHAKGLFNKQFLSSNKSVMDANLRVPVWRIAVKYGGEAEVKALQEEFKTTSSLDGREIALQSMGSVQTEELAKNVFNFMISDVRIQDAHTVSIGLGANSKVRQVLWGLIKENWSYVRNNIGERPLILERFLRVGLKKFTDREVADDMKSFFAGQNTDGYDRAVAIVLDNIDINAKYKERDEALVLEWLEARGYA